MYKVISIFHTLPYKLILPFHRRLRMSAPASPEDKPKSEPDLFFPASDSEDEDYVPEPPSTSTLGASSRSAPMSSRPSAIQSTSASKAARQPSSSPDIVPISSSSTRIETPLTRKRPSPTRTPSTTVPAGFTSGYLGEFVCEGWSLSKGKGYCSPGSKVIFERPKPIKADDDKSFARSKEKAGPARLVNGKMIHAKGKPVGGGKQMTLGGMGLGKKATQPVSATSSNIECKLYSRSRLQRRDRPSQSSIRSFASGELS